MAAPRKPQASNSDGTTWKDGDKEMEAKLDGQRTVRHKIIPIEERGSGKRPGSVIVTRKAK